MCAELRVAERRHSRGATTRPQPHRKGQANFGTPRSRFAILAAHGSNVGDWLESSCHELPHNARLTRVKARAVRRNTILALNTSCVACNFFTPDARNVSVETTGNKNKNAISPPQKWIITIIQYQYLARCSLMSARDATQRPQNHSAR